MEIKNYGNHRHKEMIATYTKNYIIFFLIK